MGPLDVTTLTGHHVILEPMQIAHAPAVAEAAAADRSSFRMTPVPDGLAETEAYINVRLTTAAAHGEALYSIIADWPTVRSALLA